MKKLWPLLPCFAVALLLALPACADVVTIDENGNGNINGAALSSSLGTDPGPGGLSGVLVYTLPFAGIQGDVLLIDVDLGIRLDVIRFNGDGTAIFYSDNVDGFDALGDTPSPPGIIYTNEVNVDEVGPEGNNGAFYTPNANQPGFALGADGSPVTYHFISDSTTPEPGSILLLASGLAGLGAWRRKFRP